jgi:hypothetical protein
MKGFATVLLAIVSLAACGLSLGFWLLSYTRGGGGWHSTYGDGSLCLFYLDPDAANPYATEAFEKTPDHSGWWVWQNLLADGKLDGDHRAGGFRMRTGTIDRNDFHNDRPISPAAFRLVQVPFWSLTLATAVLPLFVWLRGRRRRRRLVKFACAECGYDMRASPGRCPECGTVPAIVQSAA